MAACAQCGWTQGHAPACALGQVTGPLQQINAGVGALVSGQAEGFAGVQNELALGNVASFAQLYVQTRELAELGQINEKMQVMATPHQAQVAMQEQQMLEQQRQAALQQVLFETEMFVRKVGDVGRRDAFAAAVMAALRMEGLNAVGVGPQHLTAIEHKRSLQAAVDELTGKWNVLVAGDAERGQAFVKAVLEVVRLQGFLGDVASEPGPIMEATTARRCERLKQDVKRWTWVVGSSPVLALVGSGLWWYACSASGSPPAFFPLLGALLLLTAYFCWKKGVPRRRVAVEGLDAAVAQRDAVAAYKAFLERPDGGGLLAAVLEKHPALRA